ncbi:uncharacterized [Tachysurus ichikawai]
MKERNEVPLRVGKQDKSLASLRPSDQLTIVAEDPNQSRSLGNQQLKTQSAISTTSHTASGAAAAQELDIACKLRGGQR